MYLPDFFLFQRPAASDCLAAQWFKDAPRLFDAKVSGEIMQDLVSYFDRSDLEKLVRMQVASQLSANKLPKLNLIFQK